jgi:hypothetical protein
MLRIAGKQNQRFFDAFLALEKLSVSVRSNRYVFGSWFADRLLAILWAYLVVRGFGLFYSPLIA